MKKTVLGLILVVTLLVTTTTAVFAIDFDDPMSLSSTSSTPIKK